ncbi:hypothetical protein DLAC_01633 [Tieghemostelium lacteum]|uniref:MYND-type domain-containing protein n=1 Tax=Tieghemostelium lacteum TaxID=361077 RepID=A0A152A5X7_TIELA|nr:hypothetical protein DLAC_01633 [Tieghemostelium lacteum]|eukprot:KYR01632.1 hypothetical protein DLAC_01633 [Tieghemostelium lacteum]
MASVYTTKRGKTKKAKLGIRKDAKNNQANKLIQKISAQGKAPVHEAPAFFDPTKYNNLLKNHSEDSELNSTPNTSSRAANGCCNGDCNTPIPTDKKKTLKLLECSGCKSVKYCCKDCQVSHWPTHKEACNKIKEQKQIENREALEKAMKLMEITEQKQQTKPINNNKVKKTQEEIETFKKLIDGQTNNNIIVDKQATTTTTTTSTSSKTTPTTVDWSLFKDDDIPEVEDIDSDDDDS